MHIARNSMRLSALLFGLSVSAYAFAATQGFSEEYITEPMPPGFQVVATELEGPVFADAQGRTLYKWPKKPLRNGDAGEVEEKPACANEPSRENAGLMSPYPPGLELPEVDTRPACTMVWPPVLAAASAKPVGKWTIVDRPDGRKQWAYDKWSLYTSVLDKQAGDVLGGSAMFIRSETGASRIPVGPKPNLPPQFKTHTTMTGRLVSLADGWSVYTFDGDSRNKSNCYDACLNGWAPILAADYARPLKDWTFIERAPGVKQWAFRGKPVYRHLTDSKTRSQDGSDTPRWRNVYTQRAPEPPKGFTMKDTMIGVVLGDPQGRTIYRYDCTDDAVDQLACDYPDAPQVYRFAICGAGDPDRCNKTFPYVLAPVGARTGNSVWSAMYIDPKTGRKTTANQAGALYVWAFRDRPIFTFAGSKGYGDKKPSDINAQSWGEFNGHRNGFQAMVYRDIFSDRDE